MPLKIVLESAEWCKPCKDVRKWLVQRGLDFEEVELNPDELVKVGMIPRVQIGRWVVKGYDPKKLQEALSRARKDST